MEPPRALVPGRSALLAAVRAYLPVHSVGMGAMDSVCGVQRQQGVWLVLRWLSRGCS